MVKNVIGKKLKGMGKTRRWLSQKTGIPKSTIKRFVNNEAPNPSAQRVIIISNAMEIPIEKLFKILDK